MRQLVFRGHMEHKLMHFLVHVYDRNSSSSTEILFIPVIAGISVSLLIFGLVFCLCDHGTCICMYVLGGYQTVDCNDTHTYRQRTVSVSSAAYLSLGQGALCVQRRHAGGCPNRDYPHSNIT